MKHVTRRAVALGGLAAAGIRLPGARAAGGFCHAGNHCPDPGVQLAEAAATAANAAETLHSIRSYILLAPPVPAPPLMMQAADGSRHGLVQFAGRGVVLNLWATWCAPCVAEMPALDELAAKLAGSNIAVVPLSLDRGGKDAVAAFYKRLSLQHLPIWLDPDGQALSVLKPRGIPTTLIIDPKGEIRARYEGAVDWAAPEAVDTLRQLAGISG